MNADIWGDFKIVSVSWVKRNKNKISTDLFPQDENNALHKIPSFLVWKFCENSAETVRFHKILTLGN